MPIINRSSFESIIPLASTWTTAELTLETNKILGIKIKK